MNEQEIIRRVDEAIKEVFGGELEFSKFQKLRFEMYYLVRGILQEVMRGKSLPEVREGTPSGSTGATN